MARKLADETCDPPFLSVAGKAAIGCGVTRLAEITGLDRIGLPVWQAIRPGSRAISVHQGKALTDAGAKIGALCEAIESHRAEQVEADGPCCPAFDLAPAQRLPDLTDVLLDRERPPDWTVPISWCAMSDIASRETVYVPHAAVSLDFRSGVPTRLERSSNGLGAGPDVDAALTTALFELLERDALAAWARKGIVPRMASRIDPATVPFDWFQHWRERLRALGARMEIHSLHTVIGAPAFRCAIQAGEAFGGGARVTTGAAAHPYAEVALAKAFAEAAQTRLTWIAAARDDYYPHHYAPGDSLEEDDDGDEDVSGRAWHQAEDLPGDPVKTTIERLAKAGYRQVLIKRLDPGDDGVAVVKAFVPGLGMLGRTRRVPA